MQETWIGYDGKTYQTKKDKLKADLKFIALLSKFYQNREKLYIMEWMVTYILMKRHC